MEEITSGEQNKVKRMKRTESQRLGQYQMHQHQIIGVPEEEEKKKGYVKIFEEIIVENFHTMEKKIVNQIQETQRVPYRINPRKTCQDTY